MIFSRVGDMWTNHYTGLEVDLSVGENVDSGTGNCGIMIAYDAGWKNFYCKTTGVPPIGCACQHPVEMYLQLRGLCPDSNIDRFYVPRNDATSGFLTLIGR